VIVELLERVHVFFDHDVALLVPVALQAPGVRVVLAEDVENVLIVEYFDSIYRCHLQSLLESLQG